MGKIATWLACASVATAIVAGGILVGRLTGAGSLAVYPFVALAGCYLGGTFAPNSRLFGANARPRRDRAELSLTFDDGPDPSVTPAISSLLAERGHRATFFVLGRHARAHPWVLTKLAADGHEVASHGDDHRLLAFSPPGELHRQLRETERAVEGAGIHVARLFRPPHGVRSPWLAATARRLGYKVCAWDGRVFDTRQPGVEVIARRVRGLLRPGAVVLLHDGDGRGRGDARDQTVSALPVILAEIEGRGLRSVPLGELVAAPKALSERP
jgi:peptidoglycan/xylan/chitin deacetylase (PgdA/CDA1 family)